MKLKAPFILFITLFSFISSCYDKNKSCIRRKLMNVKESLSDLEKEIRASPKCQTSELRPICSQGFKNWSSIATTRYFRGIARDPETINSFYDLLFEYLPADKEDLNNLKKILAKVKYSGIVDTIQLDILFNRKSVSKGCYFSILEEEDCEDSSEFDFLFTSITSDFKLEDDLLLLRQDDGYEKVKYEANLSLDFYKTIINILQIGSYDNAIQMIDAIDD